MGFGLQIFFFRCFGAAQDRAVISNQIERGSEVESKIRKCYPLVKKLQNPSSILNNTEINETSPFVADQSARDQVGFRDSLEITEKCQTNSLLRL